VVRRTEIETRKTKIDLLVSSPRISLSFGRGSYIAIQYLDHSLRQAIRFSVFGLGNELGIDSSNQVISHLESGAACLPAELNILLIRVSSKTFGNVRPNRLNGTPELTIQCEAFLDWQLFHQSVNEYSEGARQLPRIEVLKVTDWRSRAGWIIREFRISHFEFRHRH
jgi:hypothetical protein